MKLDPVINRCHFELATGCGAFWSYRMVKLGKELVLDYADLDGAKATKSNFDLAVDLRPNALICGVGHGGFRGKGWIYTGQRFEVLLDTSNAQDMVRIKGRYLGLLSCKGGQALEAFLAAGARAVMAYRENFVFCGANLNNIADAIAETFGDSSLTWDQTLVREKLQDTEDSVADQRAYEASQARFDYHYGRATYGTHKQLLMYDKIIQCHGTPGAIPPPPPPSGKCGNRILVRVDDETVYTRTVDHAVDVETLVEPCVLPETP